MALLGKNASQAGVPHGTTGGERVNNSADFGRIEVLSDPGSTMSRFSSKMQSHSP